MPSVSSARGTNSSTSAMVVTMVGAIDRPATNSATANAGRFPTSWSGIILTAIAQTPTRKRREALPRGRTSPKTTPARHDPSE